MSKWIGLSAAAWFMVLVWPGVAKTPRTEEGWFAGNRQERKYVLQRSIMLIKSIERALTYPYAGVGELVVRCHQYFNTYTQRYVPVYSVEIHRRGVYRDRITRWNTGSLRNFIVRWKVKAGRYYQVTVIWEDGKRKTWDYFLGGRRVIVDVYYP